MAKVREMWIDNHVGGNSKAHSDHFTLKETVYRGVITIEHGQKEVMKIIDRETGRWCKFRVPHGTEVAMSRLGSGFNPKHEVEGATGVYTLVYVDNLSRHVFMASSADTCVAKRTT